MAQHDALPPHRHGIDAYYDPDQYADMPLGLLQRLAATGDVWAQEEIDRRLKIPSSDLP